MKMEDLMIGQRLVLSMSKILLILAFVIIAPVGVTAQVWTVLAVDPKGDGRDPALPDAAQLSYRYDKPQDLLWFRVSFYGKPIEESFGVTWQSRYTGRPRSEGPVAAAFPSSHDRPAG
jgi:hypothetical protein